MPLPGLKVEDHNWNFVANAKPKPAPAQVSTVDAILAASEGITGFPHLGERQEERLLVEYSALLEARAISSSVHGLGLQHGL
jgi:hypothetical protein